MWFIIYRNVPAFPAKEIKVKRSQKSYTRKEWVQEYSERKNILFFSEVNCGQTCQEWLKVRRQFSRIVFSWRISIHMTRAKPKLTTGSAFCYSLMHHTEFTVFLPCRPVCENRNSRWYSGGYINHFKTGAKLRSRSLFLKKLARSIIVNDASQNNGVFIFFQFQDLASKKVTVDSATLFLRGVARPGFFGGVNCIACEDC